MESERAQRAIRRDTVREHSEQQEAAGSAAKKKLRMQQNQGRARTMHSRVMMREQTAGRTSPATGRTVRQLSGRISTPVWTPLFINMLTHMLGGLPFWGDVQIIEHTDNSVQIQSRQQRMSQPEFGSTRRGLCITVLNNAPKDGFIKDSLEAHENDWTRSTCLNHRNCRVRLGPFQEITQRTVSVQTEFGEVDKFRDFLTWDHSAYLTVGASYLLFHTDFNISYPVMKIIAETVKDYYLRRSA